MVAHVRGVAPKTLDELVEILAEGDQRYLTVVHDGVVHRPVVHPPVRIISACQQVDAMFFQVRPLLWDVHELRDNANLTCILCLGLEPS